MKACDHTISTKLLKKIIFNLNFLLLFWSSFTHAEYHAAEIPRKLNHSNLIVASYNIKWFQNGNQNYKKLARVIKNFDICGIVEIRNEKAMIQLVSNLNKETDSVRGWGYVYGMRTHRPNGKYHEAYGVVWNRDKVEIGNGIVSNVWDYNEDFRNDPFMVSFDWRGIDFTLILIHTRWSDDSDGSREGEIKAIADYIRYLRGFLPEEDIILAGDFNYSADEAPMVALMNKADLYELTSSDKTTIGKKNIYINSYDHIFGTQSILSLVDEKSGRAFDVTQFLYGERSEHTMKESKRELSDHIPVFIELNRDMNP